MRRRNVNFYRYGNAQQIAFLIFQLWDKLRHLERKPPVTIAFIVVNLLLFVVGSVQRNGPLGDLLRMLPRDVIAGLSLLQPFISTSKTCLHPRRVIVHRERWRLLTSALIHIDERHVLFNMISFVHKGVTLESQMGHRPFFALTAYLAFVSNVTYCLVASAAAAVGFPRLMGSCAVGFSGVLFGLGAVLTSEREYRDAARSIFGFRVPGALGAAAVEVLGVQLMVPRASMTGHACGAVAGLTFVYAKQLLTRSRFAGGAPRRRRVYGGGVSGRVE